MALVWTVARPAQSQTPPPPPQPGAAAPARSEPPPAEGTAPAASNATSWDAPGGSAAGAAATAAPQATRGQPATAPLPGYGYPPPGYGYPPPGYGYRPRGAGRAMGYDYRARPLPPPQTLPLEEGAPAPEGYHRSTRISRGLVIAGAVSLGSLWAISALLASSAQDSNESDGYLPLLAPIAGPFIGMATLDASTAGTLLLALDGLTQAAGAGMLMSALISPTRVWEHDTIGQLTVVPSVSGTNWGLSLVGEM